MLPIPGTTEEAALLRLAFERGGLTTDGLAEAFGLDHGDRAVLLGPRSYLAPTAGDAVVRLWFAGGEVAAHDLAELVRPLDVGRLEELGLLVRDGDLVSSTIRITPVAGSWFAGDLAGEHVGDLPADHVLGPTASALTLEHLTIRRRGRAALDIGTGCGIHAVLAAAYHETVVATDVSTRAIALGRWAAWLNEVHNIEWRLGSLFEPVEGERFDLIVSAPPFVITPDLTSGFRDGGMEGDSFSRSVAVGAARHLEPGGVATVLVNWGCAAGDDDEATPLRWIGGEECDALALVHRIDSPVAYASRWAEPVASTAEEHRDLTARWAMSYSEAGWDRLGSGALVLRRPLDGVRRWSLGISTPPAGLGPAGEQLAAIVERCDLVSDGLSDELVLDTAPFVVNQSLSPVDGGGLRLTSASVRIGGGLPFERDLDRVGLALLAGADGTRTLVELIESVASDLGVEAADLADRARAVLPELVTLGFLVAP